MGTGSEGLSSDDTSPRLWPVWVKADFSVDILCISRKRRFCSMTTEWWQNCTPMRIFQFINVWSWFDFEDNFSWDWSHSWMHYNWHLVYAYTKHVLLWGYRHCGDSSSIGGDDCTVWYSQSKYAYNLNRNSPKVPDTELCPFLLSLTSRGVSIYKTGSPANWEWEYA